LLKDSDWAVRWGAALGVGLAFQGTGDRGVIDVLRPLLKDSDWAVRWGAALGVGLAFQGTGGWKMKIPLLFLGIGVGYWLWDWIAIWV